MWILWLTTIHRRRSFLISILPTWKTPPLTSHCLTSDRVYEEFTAVALQVDDESAVDWAAADEAAGTTSLTREESYGASPGYTAEIATLQLIQWFLYAISALVIGAFFTVLTIQRRQEIAVLRAMGASTRYLSHNDQIIQIGRDGGLLQ